MLRQGRHPDVAMLLQYADGELRARALARVRKHLTTCLACSERLREIESASAALASAQRAKPPAAIAAPRALLRARMAEAAGLPPGPSRSFLRLARGLALASVLAVLGVAGLTLGRWAAHSPAEKVSLRPDPALTPGRTRAANLSQLCALNHDDVVHPVSAAVQQRVLDEYGIADLSPEDYEVDYLITPGLGGADDLRNLWPQPHTRTVWNSYAKDQLEDRLHGMVCDGRLSLRTAQQQIAGDWIAAYKRYFHTDQPV